MLTEWLFDLTIQDLHIGRDKLLSWLRDATFTLLAFVRHQDHRQIEAKAFAKVFVIIWCARMQECRMAPHARRSWKFCEMQVHSVA
jgi:hypothetical protein